MKWDCGDIIEVLRRIERKIDIILKNSNPDFSQEDASVVAATARSESSASTVEAAIEQLPPQISITNQERK